MKLYKSNCVVDLISYADYLDVTGQKDEDVYPRMMEGPQEKEEDGDFIYRIDLLNAKPHKPDWKLIAQLPSYIIVRNQFGVEYYQ